MTSKITRCVTPRDLDILRTLEYSPLTARQIHKASYIFAQPFTAASSQARCI